MMSLSVMAKSSSSANIVAGGPVAYYPSVPSLFQFINFMKAFKYLPPAASAFLYGILKIIKIKFIQFQNI